MTVTRRRGLRLLLGVIATSHQDVVATGGVDTLAAQAGQLQCPS
ncbi:DUF6245 family protein [Streptomyces sp. NPDC058424]